MRAPRSPPYLPFLSGAPAFTVGLSPIAPALWLTPDGEAASLPAKRALMVQRWEEVYASLGNPAAQAAEAEAAAVISAALGPQDQGFAAVGAAVSDDLVVLCSVPEGGGQGFAVSSALLCSPTYFSAAEALGKTLPQLHGPVPDQLGPGGAQALGARIGRVFQGLRPGQVLERFNWTVQAGDTRFTPSGAEVRARAQAAPASAAAELLHLRVERQTIVKLPATGAVLFTIRVALDPLVAVFAVPGARAAFAHAWANAPPHVAAYKRWDTHAHLVEHLLNQRA